MTRYNDGLGACGWTSKDSDFVVALNSAQYGSGQYCGRRIEIHANGKSAIAEIVDECPGCSADGLDLSNGLFRHFAHTEDGVITGSWNFVDDHKHPRRTVALKTDLGTASAASDGSSPAAAPASFSSSNATSALTPRSAGPSARHAPFTWYDAGLGACGKRNKPSDLIVALNSAQYGSGQYCGLRIEIEANGKTAVAEIVDECPGCGAGGLDLSKGLFKHFAPDQEGVIYGSWRLVEGEH
jgi:expansin (peptidoglycan-binding protein)